MLEGWKYLYVFWFFNGSKGLVLEIVKKCLIKVFGKILY